MPGHGVSGLQILKGRSPQVNSRYLLDYAKIDWRQQNPYSRQYQDIYWSRDNPIHEKLHVFVNRHQLEARGKQVSHFNIVETGFGFGNNFLLAAKYWREQRHSGILNYIAIENSPVNPADLAKHYKTVRLTYSDWLLEHYPLPLNTSFILWLEDNIRLILVFDDVISALDNLTAKIDAWFLDGFSPSTNPDLWNPLVYGRIFACSKPGATLSTYTVAGHVRKGLTDAGFETSKVSGFGGKAEMLTGRKPGVWTGSSIEKKRVAVIGSGIAGMGCVEALQRRNVEVQLISNEDPNAASSIPQLAVYPQLGVAKEKRYQFSLAANAYTQHRNPLFNKVKLRWYSQQSLLQARMQRIAQQFPDEYLNCPDQTTVYFLQAGWLSNAAFNGEDYRLAEAANIRFIEDQWEVYDVEKNLITRVDYLVIAMGIHSSKLVQAPLTPVRGQALTIRLSTHIPGMVAGDLNLIPATGGFSTLGSTFQRGDTDLRARQSDTESLLNSLQQFLPGTSPEVTTVHVGIRATTRDRLPLVGLVPNQQRLYLSAGFGSHGATHARLCGEHIANLICDEPTALNRSQQAMLALERFQLRDSRKN